MEMYANIVTSNYFILARRHSLPEADGSATRSESLPDYGSVTVRRAA
jgi:hypothetical protein